MANVMILDEYEYEALKLDGFERDKLLTLIFNSIKTPSYIDPIPVLHYLETFYPNRLQIRLDQITTEEEQE